MGDNAPKGLPVYSPYLAGSPPGNVKLLLRSERVLRDCSRCVESLRFCIRIFASRKYIVAFICDGSLNVTSTAQLCNRLEVYARPITSRKFINCVVPSDEK